MVAPDALTVGVDQATVTRRRVGVIVNPIAGMGGPLGLAGTDGDRADIACRLGAEPTAHRRARRAMRRLAELVADLEVLAPAGVMGQLVASGVGLDVTVVATPAEPTSSADTIVAARQMADRGVDLILFAGGDGTAHDVASAVGRTVPLLGIPTGVKMHSSVFAFTPERAGEAAARFLDAGGRAPLVDCDIVDHPTDLSDGAYSTVVVAAARCPQVPGAMQSTKQTTRSSSDAALDALTASMARQVDPDTLYIVGPGTTTARFLTALGVPATVTGVDLVRAGRVIRAGATEREIHEAVRTSARARLVLGVIGGQGFLLGRGNQQLSPRILRAVGPDDIDVIAAADKLVTLVPPILRVDLGTDEADPVLPKHLRVRTGIRRSTIMRVG